MTFNVGAELAVAGASVIRHRPRNPLANYVRALIAIDLAVLAGCVAAGIVARPADFPQGDAAIIGLAILVAWIVMLALVGAYDIRILGVGTQEFVRILSSSVLLGVMWATAAYFVGAESERLSLVVTVGLGLLGLIIARRVARWWLHRQRSRGRFSSRTLILGTKDACDELTRAVERDPSAGLLVVERLPATPSGDATAWLDAVMTTIARCDIATVVVTDSCLGAPENLRGLSWRLQEPGVELLVAPSVGDLAGPRASMRRSDRLPLVHLDEPHLTPAQQHLKRVADIFLSGLGLLILLPFLALVALIVAFADRGPVLFWQQRVGRQGDLFLLPKFRTMVEGAHQLHQEVVGAPGEGSRESTLADPRITPVGRVLRRTSIDELPQLWCVLRGDMSLVGPRPLMPEEMPWLEPHGQRRHVMRPGLTGLWQVAGRKEVDWSDRIRLDLEYVERWSPALDVVLLLRTIKVVITGEGAR